MEICVFYLAFVVCLNSRRLAISTPATMELNNGSKTIINDANIQFIAKQIIEYKTVTSVEASEAELNFVINSAAKCFLNSINHQ